RNKSEAEPPARRRGRPAARRKAGSRDKDRGPEAPVIPAEPSMDRIAAPPPGFEETDFSAGIFAAPGSESPSALRPKSSATAPQEVSATAVEDVEEQDAALPIES